MTSQPNSSALSGFRILVAKNVRHFLEARGFEFVRTKPAGAAPARAGLIRPGGQAAARLPAAAPDPQRFFSVELEARPGINHLRFALELLVREAVALGRTPVAFKPRFDPRHNLGHDLDTDWERYIDLEQVALHPPGGGEPLRLRLLPSTARASLAPLATAWFERRHVVSAAENRRWDFVLRCNRTGLEVAGVHDAASGLPGYVVKFAPSAQVLALAQAVVDELGDYCAMHVRRDDMLGLTEQYPHLDADTRPERMLATLAPHLPPGSRLYVMTNERQPGYFDPLRRVYDLRQFSDFAPLRALLEGPAPDNFLLFEVEKLLFERAALQVHTFTHPEGGRRIALCRDKGWA
ncbi:hypothetical protein CKO44_02230 [Rubrivivax gelatinosus]|uniref:hypothetical protein n=1 Tax=Rubrivivax gelatinosus TaxID=28068 RepID=UPI0019054853|nr:hypothetical protein [Rubrivivax gelatinosus]MBK1612282.1 hypothetical protein [Rubrivivax gelatinosus]